MLAYSVSEYDQVLIVEDIYGASIGRNSRLSGPKFVFAFGATRESG